jgi:chaperone modulatory protein CbpM
MPIDNLVLVRLFCSHQGVEMSFIDKLEAYGLISIHVVNDDKYILSDDLKDLEKIVEFYYDLGINLEGIEVILNLLIQNNILRHKLAVAQNRLRHLDLQDEYE